MSLSINYPAVVMVTPDIRIDARFDADAAGYAINQMMVTVNRTIRKGLVQFVCRRIVDDLDDDTMDLLHTEVQRQIEYFNNNLGGNIGTLPKLTPITERAILPAQF